MLIFYRWKLQIQCLNLCCSLKQVVDEIDLHLFGMVSEPEMASRFKFRLDEWMQFSWKNLELYKKLEFWVQQEDGSKYTW